MANDVIITKQPEAHSHITTVVHNRSSEHVWVRI